jgi:hypothetical protein
MKVPSYQLWCTMLYGLLPLGEMGAHCNMCVDDEHMLSPHATFMTACWSEREKGPAAAAVSTVAASAAAAAAAAAGAAAEAAAGAAGAAGEGEVIRGCAASEPSAAAGEREGGTGRGGCEDAAVTSCGRAGVVVPGSGAGKWRVMRRSSETASTVLCTADSHSQRLEA